MSDFMDYDLDSEPNDSDVAYLVGLGMEALERSPSGLNISPE